MRRGFMRSQLIHSFKEILAQTILITAGSGPYGGIVTYAVEMSHALLT